MNPADAQSGSALGAIAVTVAPALLPIIGLAAYGARQSHRRVRAWQTAAREITSGPGRSSLVPSRHGVSGTYRGRLISAQEQQNVVRVDVRAANRARLLDEISSRSPLPNTPWLNTAARERLESLTNTVRERKQSWLIHVQDRTVMLICGGVPPESDRFRSLLDLACDLAEGVDNVSAAKLAPHCIALR